MHPDTITLIRWWGHIWLVLAALTALGCATGAPDLTTPTSTTAPTHAGPLPAFQTGRASATAALGLFELTADFTTGTARLTPLITRNAAGFDLGDSLIPDLTSLFTDADSLCGDCFKVTTVGIDIPTGLPFVEAAVRHPIPTGRPDLSAFDLQAVLISDTPTQPLLALPGMNRTLYPPYLANADGATDQISAAVGFALGTPLAGQVFPFKNIAVDDTAGNFAGSNVNGFADVNNPSGHNVFASGDTATVRFVLDTGEIPVIKMFVALTASFYRSYTTKGAALYQKNNPVYFLPEGNRKEAWQVSVDVLGNALVAGDTGSRAVLRCTIRDWQNGLSAQGAGWDPAIANPATQPRDAIPTASDVTGLALEIPGVTSGLVDLTALPHTGDGRTAATALVYDNLPVVNTAGAAAGSYVGALRVRDSRATEATGPGEGDVLFNDGATFGTLANFDTYAIFQLTVADDVVFVGSDFTNTGTRLLRTGASIQADVDFFAGIGPTVSNAVIHNGQAVVVSSGPSFTGAGAVQVFDCATGAELLNYPTPGNPNPFDITLLSDTEAYVTGFLSGQVLRINIDPAFGGSRDLGSVNLNSIADPGFLPRPQEIIQTASGRVFVACAHFDLGFTPAPAGILVELNPTTNTIANDIDTLGLRNPLSLVEVPGANRLTLFGPGTYSGDGGSGTFHLGTNTWSLDPFPAGLAWGEAAVNSTGRGFVTDAFAPTIAHIGLPFGGTIDHQLAPFDPPGPPFPFISALRVDAGDFLYATEFGGHVRAFATATASMALAPTVVADFTISGGADAIGVRE